MKGLLFRLVLPPGLLALSVASALAQTASDFELSGDYYFYSSSQKNGEPLCSERWHFNADGTMIIYSGEEVVTKRFHTERQKFGQLIFAEPLTTNGQPNCLGHSAAGVTPASQPFLGYISATGAIVLCWRIGTAEHPALKLIGTLIRTAAKQP